METLNPARFQILVKNFIQLQFAQNDVIKSVVANQKRSLFSVQEVNEKEPLFVWYQPESDPGSKVKIGVSLTEFHSFIGSFLA